MPRRSTDHTRMTRDDDHASRVFSLAVKFYGSSLPISSVLVHTELYPSLSDESFARAFHRDRALLASCGIIIRDVSEQGDQSLWKVDEYASYVLGEGIDEQDGRLLQVLCHDLVSDPSFAYRDELRMALAKVASIPYDAAFEHAGSLSGNRLLSTLVSCQSNRRVAKVAYVGADATERRRYLNIYGSFGFHDRTYFVASTSSKNGKAQPDSIRTYRLDRFKSVQEMPGSHYEIPADFCVDDYLLLPFQMGEIRLYGSFTAAEHMDGEARRTMANFGEICQRDPLLWKVGISNPELAASWVIGVGLLPVDPPELLRCYQASLADAKRVSLMEDDVPQMGLTQHHARRAGRTGGAALLRQLITLAANLDASGKTLTDIDIQVALGVDRTHARHLIMMLSMTYGESIDYLPVIPSDDDDEVTLMEGASFSGRRIRLTKGETQAILAALQTIGVPKSDPLRATLEREYAAADAIPQNSFIPEQEDDSSEVTALQVLGRAIVSHEALNFSYTAIGTSERSLRRVVPITCRRMGDSWYLDAYDLDRQGMRCFQIDAMEQLETCGPAPELGEQPPKQDPQEVQVLFADKLLIDLFGWDDLIVVSEGEQGILTKMPWYGSRWLARRLAACGAKIQVDNAELLDQIHREAQALR